MVGNMKRTNTDKVTFKPRETESKYQEIIDAALKLKVGQSILCPVPKGDLDTDYRNRLSVAIARKVKPYVEDETQVVRLRCTANNEVAISLIAVEE